MVCGMLINKLLMQWSLRGRKPEAISCLCASEGISSPSCYSGLRLTRSRWQSGRVVIASHCGWRSNLWKTQEIVSVLRALQWHLLIAGFRL